MDYFNSPVELKSAGVRRSVYYYWWLREMMYELCAQYMLCILGKSEEPVADEPVFVQKTGA